MSTSGKDNGYVRFPARRFLGMLAFLATLIAAILIDGGSGAPWGLTWSTFYVGWLAYLIIIVTTFIFISEPDRKGEGE